MPFSIIFWNYFSNHAVVDNFLVEYSSFWRCYFFFLFLISSILSFRWSHSQRFKCNQIVRWESKLPHSICRGVLFVFFRGLIFKKRKFLQRSTFFLLASHSVLWNLMFCALTCNASNIWTWIWIKLRYLCL